MCGIVGIWNQTADAKVSLDAAVDRLNHRGPDDSGVWFDETAGIGLGSTRLSILDLSDAGHQPMTSVCERYVIVFNGEIYNHMELRARLENSAFDSSRLSSRGQGVAVWRGHSDTETLLAHVAAWGVEKTLKATVGMFALALWDRQEKKLVLARDRLGEKPLYYGYVNGTFCFASELKALRTIPGFEGHINRGALALLMRHNYVPAPHSIFLGISKLPAGTWLELPAALACKRDLPQPHMYWSARKAALNGVASPLAFESDAEAVSALETELSRSVLGQMLADVPLGAFLSGGIDSSTVVALMQVQSSRPIKTFSVGFREGGYDEAQFASAVARHLGTEHTELYISPKDALGVIPKLPIIYDEPFSDSSQIPTFLIAQLARQRVTVSLSGDGGDELFGGYTRYFLAARLWRKIDRMPRAMRRAAARLILTVSPSAWDHLYQLAAPFIPRHRRWPALGDKLHKGAALLHRGSGMALYRGLVSHWDPAEIVLNTAEPSTLLTDDGLSVLSLTEKMMLLDAVTYLPDDILVKVDRAAMAVSLETRVPLLDHRIFEFAWRLPLRYRVRDGIGKWLLRQVLYKHVPYALIDRPKMGFGVPIDSWLRGPLRGWAEELLSESRLKREGFFDSTPIRKKWREHLAGARNWQYHLWDVLMFQAWLEQQQTR